MRYSFRLAEVVGHVPDPRKRPGTIKNICEFTGLDRHQVASLLKNEIKYVPLDALSKLCEFLIDRGFADGRGAARPAVWRRAGALLGTARPPQAAGAVPGRAARRREDSLDDAWVVASDSVLLGELLSGVTTLGGTAKHRRVPQPPRTAERCRRRRPARRRPPIRIPSTCTRRSSGAPARPSPTNAGRWPAARTNRSRGTAGDKALVCLGSNKSNPVVELLLASAFGCEPFESQDGLPSAGQRSCPIFLRYRDNDPQPPSCCGGLRLATPRPGHEGAGHLVRKGQRRVGLCSVGRDQERRGVRVLHPPRIAGAHGNGPGRLLGPGDAALGAAPGPPRRGVLAARL